MLYPLAMFCCGCSVPVGVGIILVCHLAECVLYVFSVCSTIIFHHTSFSSSWSFPSQMFYTAWCLVGIPIILAAALGVVQRTEASLRVYLFYLTSCFLLNACWLGYFILLTDPCQQAVGDILRVVTEHYGQSFFCGAAQIASYLFMGAAIILHVYCMWVVWSLCEDVHLGANGPNLSELIPNKDYEIKKVRHLGDGPQAGIIGFAHTKLPGSYPSPYGAVNAPGRPVQTGPGAF